MVTLWWFSPDNQKWQRTYTAAESVLQSARDALRGFGYCTAFERRH